MIIPTRLKLEQLADEKYRQFSSALSPDTTDILGVRLPELRKIAKSIAKQEEEWRSYIYSNDIIYHEEIMLQGMIIGYIRMGWKEKEPLIRAFIPKISSWGICDTFCSGLKFKSNERDEVYKFIQPCLFSNRAYEIRFAVVMLLCYFVESSYAKDAFSAFDTIKHEDYYVKMAIAWAISYYYRALPQGTMVYLKDNKLENWTYNKALQKIVESRVIDEDTKDIIRSMRRKSK